MTTIDSFPRYRARTRRFTLGAPRNLKVSNNGKRVAFLRSSGPTDPVNALWVLNLTSGSEHLVADPRQLCEGSESIGEVDLPAAERALRERVRESGAGIVSYDTDPRLTVAVFVLAGTLWRVDLNTYEAIALPAQLDAFDPRIAPDCQHVAYVSGSALMVTGGDNGDQIVIDEPGGTVNWGSAEFVAAEEMGRTRGHWWSPDSRRLLATRVDTSSVEKWWISTPATPGLAPTEIRYPAAGTTNAVVCLAILNVSDIVGAGELSESGAGAHSEAGLADAEVFRVDVEWNTDGWEYLAGVNWSTDGILLAVQSRDQRTLAVLECDPTTGACSTRYQWYDEAWVELVPGMPRLVDGRLITVEDRGSARRLCVDGKAITPDDVQVRRVESADTMGAIVVASTDSIDTHIAHVGWDGALTWLTDGGGVNSVAVGGGTTVLIQQSLEWHGSRCTVLPGALHTAHYPASIVSHAANPGLDLNVEIIMAGPRRIATAIVLPTHAHTKKSLPVLLNPYGGPHAQRVQRAQALYHTSQWFAEQGFAVVTVDGRGTPGRSPDFERAVRGDLAGPVLEDQIAGLQAAAQHEHRLDLSRVAIRGWSFGGYLAVLAVLRRPDIFGAAIAGAPVTNWRLYDTHYTERYLGHPSREPQNYEQTDLIRMASRLRRPLLLIHGLADDNVVSAHTLQLSQALLEAGRFHTVVPLSDVTHMATHEQVAENLLLVQLDFLCSAFLKWSCKGEL